MPELKFNTDKNRFLDAIKGCKVEDDDNNRFEIVDIKVFNGRVTSIGLKDADGVIKFATKNVFNKMASIR